MSNHGFVKISRNLYQDPIFLSLSCEYRSILMAIIMNCAFETIEMNDHGKITTLKPGQILTTERQLINLSFPPTNDKKLLQRYKSLIHRALDKFEKLGFSNQQTNHRKSIITIVRKDILEYIEPTNEPKTNQARTINKNDKNDKNNNDTPTPLNLVESAASDSAFGLDFSVFDGWEFPKDEKYVISEKDKTIFLKKYPTQRIQAALRYFQSQPVKKTLAHGINWHCSKPHILLPPTPHEEVDGNIKISEDLYRQCLEKITKDVFYMKNGRNFLRLQITRNEERITKDISFSQSSWVFRQQVEKILRDFELFVPKIVDMKSRECL